MSRLSSHLESEAANRIYFLEKALLVLRASHGVGRYRVFLIDFAEVSDIRIFPSVVSLDAYAA